MGGGHGVPLAAPADGPLEGEVGDVGDGAVRVAGRGVDREVAVVELVAAGDVAGSDHAGVADVDDVRVDHVQRDATAEQRDRPDHQPRGGNERDEAPARRAGTKAEHEHPNEQVQQDGIDERD